MVYRVVANRSKCYPASDDIIFIHTCVISFLTNQLAVFFGALSSTSGFRRVFRRLPLSFGLLGVLEFVFSRVEVKFIPSLLGGE